MAKTKKMKPMTKAQFYAAVAEKLNETEAPNFKFELDGEQVSGKEYKGLIPLYIPKHVKYIMGCISEVVEDNLAKTGKIPLGDIVVLKLAERNGRWMKNQFQGGKLMWVNPKTVIKAQLPKSMRDQYNEVKKVKPGPKPKVESEEASEEEFDVAAELKALKKKFKAGKISEKEYKKEKARLKDME